METKYYIPEDRHSLFKEALNIATTKVVVREYRDGTSYDMERPATKQESEVIGNILFGAWEMLKWGTHTSNEVMNIASTCEFISMQFFPGEYDHHINTYDTIYLPLISNWNMFARDEDDV